MTTSRMTTGAPPKRRRNPRVGMNINEHVCSADAQRSPTKYCKLTWNHFVVGSFAAVMMVFLCSLCCAELGFHADRRRLASSSSTTSSEVIYDSSTITTADIKYDDDVTGKCENYPEKHTTAEACKAADCKSWMIFAGQVQAVKACFVCGGSGHNPKLPNMSYSDCLTCGGNGMSSDDPENVQIWNKPHDESFVYIRDNGSKEYFYIFQAGRRYACDSGAQQLLQNKEWILIELKGHSFLSKMRNRWFHADKSEAFLKFILNMTAPENTTKQVNFLPSTCPYCKGRRSGCSGCNRGEIDRLSETQRAIRWKFRALHPQEEQPEPDTPLPFWRRWGLAITESPMLDGFWNWVG
jgi:hypothetical protein